MEAMILSFLILSQVIVFGGDAAAKRRRFLEQENQ
jgi:hypothetical protein